MNQCSLDKIQLVHRPSHQCCVFKNTAVISLCITASRLCTSCSQYFRLHHCKYSGSHGTQCYFARYFGDPTGWILQNYTITSSMSVFRWWVEVYTDKPVLRLRKRCCENSVVICLFVFAENFLWKGLKTVWFSSVKHVIVFETVHSFISLWWWAQSMVVNMAVQTGWVYTFERKKQKQKGRVRREKCQWEGLVVWCGSLKNSQVERLCLALHSELVTVELPPELMFTSGVFFPKSLRVCYMVSWGLWCVFVCFVNDGEVDLKWFMGQWSCKARDKNLSQMN